MRGRIVRRLAAWPGAERFVRHGGGTRRLAQPRGLLRYP